MTYDKADGIFIVYAGNAYWKCPITLKFVLLGFITEYIGGIFPILLYRVLLNYPIDFIGIHIVLLRSNPRHKLII